MKKIKELTVDEQFEMYVLIERRRSLSEKWEKIYRVYFPRYFWNGGWQILGCF